MRDMCWKCHRAQKNCLCAYMPPIKSRTRFLFLMHPLEARKERTGTGRLCLAALPNSRLFVGVDFSKDTELMAELQRPGTVTALLYPGHTAVNLSESSPKALRPEEDFDLQIIVLDGTWPCAKKMMRMNPWFMELPKVSFTPGRRSAFSIKQQPHELCLSSIEAVHQVLDDLNKHGYESLNGSHNCLMDVFGRMIQFQIDCINDPNIPSYRRKCLTPPEERVPSKKWEKRNVFFIEGVTEFTTKT